MYKHLLAVSTVSTVIDSDLVMRTHVQFKTASRRFAVLRQRRQIRQCVSSDTVQTRRGVYLQTVTVATPQRCA